VFINTSIESTSWTMYQNTYSTVCIGRPPSDASVTATISTSAPAQHNASDAYAHAVVSSANVAMQRAAHVHARKTMGGASKAVTAERLPAAPLPSPGSKASNGNS